MAFSEEEVREFTIEAEELLDSCEKSLLALDQGADLKAHYDSIFRAFHSIKGAASMMEMPTLQAHMHQLENILTEQKSGASLGKVFIDLFQGGSDAAREVLQGKSINFVYEVTVSSPTVPAPEAVKVQKIASLGRVIVVDDEPDLVSLLSSILISENYEVLGITDSTQVCKEVERFKPSVVFTDIAMPKMNGLQLLAEMKHKHPDVPVVFISGEVNKNSLVEAIALGVHGVIEKPFTISDVIQFCNQAVKHFQSAKLLTSSMNLLMYQFSDLDGFLEQAGKDDIRKVIRSEITQLMDQRRRLRATA